MHIAAGRDHGVAVKSDGTVWAWGLNTSGQVGDGTKTARRTPVQVSRGRLGRRGRDRCGLLGGPARGRRLRTGARTARGELGNGKTADNPNPALIAGLPTIRKIDCGRDHTLAVTTTGALWDWGWDMNMQLADSQTTNKKKPQQISGITNAVEGSGGQNYSVLLRT